MITLSSHPVTEVGQNVFAGESAVEIEFSRQDLEVTDVSLGTDNTIIITIAEDITASLSVGEFLYLGSGDYAMSGEVLSISATEINVDIDWIGAATGGYINYKQNYYVEMAIISPDNELISLLPFTLRDDGDAAGTIKIDVSILNDLNTIDFPDFTELYEMSDSRVRFDQKYREVWREEQDGSYVTISKPIIIYPAKELGTVEEFTNQFDQPEYYKGYPNGAVLLHSDEAPSGAAVLSIYYDELDANKDSIAENRLIGSIDALTTYGRLFAPLSDLDLLDDTEFIQLSVGTTTIPEFNPDDFSSDFNIG